MKTKINDWHYFEIMDRTHVMMCDLETHVITHLVMTKTQIKKLEKAQALMMDVYQWAGAKFRGWE